MRQYVWRASPVWKHEQDSVTSGSPQAPHFSAGLKIERIWNKVLERVTTQPGG